MLNINRYSRCEDDLDNVPCWGSSTRNGPDTDTVGQHAFARSGL